MPSGDARADRHDGPALAALGGDRDPVRHWHKAASRSSAMRHAPLQSWRRAPAWRSRTVFASASDPWRGRRLPCRVQPVEAARLVRRRGCSLNPRVVALLSLRRHRPGSAQRHRGQLGRGALYECLSGSMTAPGCFSRALKLSTFPQLSILLGGDANQRARLRAKT